MNGWNLNEAKNITNLKGRDTFNFSARDQGTKLFSIELLVTFYSFTPKYHQPIYNDLQL